MIQHTVAIYELYHNDETNILLINTLQLFQLQIGFSGNIFKSPQRTHHGNSVWTRQWVNELADFNLQICIPNTLDFQPQRKNDNTFMDVITSLETNITIIEQLNICRQFLKIIFLSDIITSNGTCISKDILSMKPNQSTYEWPYIPNPPIKLQQIWTKYIQKHFCEPKTNKLLRQYRLGTCIIPPSKSHTQFPYYTSSNTAAIYKIAETNITSSLITNLNRTTLTCDEHYHASNLPEDASPITPITTSTFKYNPLMTFTPRKLNPVTTFAQFVNTLSPYEKLCIQNFHIVNPELLCYCVTHHNKLIICTDGSYKQGYSGGAAIITNENEEILVTGFNPDTGHPWFQCSYQSESQACLSVYIFLTKYCKYIGAPIPPSIYYCDNQGLIQKLSTGLYINKHSSSKDILKQLKIIIPNNVSFHHVYAHQDQQKITLNHPEYINCIADTIASHNATPPQQIHPN